MKPSVKRLGVVALDGLIVAAWCASVALAMSHEGIAWPGAYKPIRFLQISSDQVQEQWFGIYYQSRKVGFAHLSLIPDEMNGVPGLRLIDYGRMYFSLLGLEQVLELRAEAFIDSDYRIQSMEALLNTPSYKLSLSGSRKGDEFAITLSSPHARLTRSFKDPKDEIWISGLSSWAAFHKLAVGDKGSAWLLNPLSLSPEKAYFYVKGNDLIDGKKAIIIETDYRGIASTTWLASDGIVLKETSPMGWELQSEPMEKAISGLSAKAARLICYLLSRCL
jgi:hypothetical protein